jgi:hypothetical protein
MALELTDGKVEGQDGAAKLLGVHPGTLRNRMRKLGIPFGRIKKSFFKIIPSIDEGLGRK